MLTACGLSAEDTAATYVAQTAEAVTETPLPPTPTPPPTNTPLPPTETPTPTPTPVPFAELVNLGMTEGEVLFEDDFESGNAAQWSPYWGVWQVVDEDGVEGNKVFYGKSGEIITPIWASREWTNYQLDTRMRILDLPDAESGVFLHVRSPNAMGCPTYELGFSQTGVGLNYYDVTCSLARDLGYSEVVPLRNEWMDLRVAVVDSRLLVYLDQQLLIDATDDEVPNGGLRMMSWKDAEVYIDDLRVVELVSG